MDGKRTYLNIRNKGGEKSCGYVDWKRQTYISVREKEHLFIKFDGLGISETILDYLDSVGISRILIVFLDKFLIASVNKFYFNGIEYDDNGDKQLILPLKNFEVSKKIEIVEKQEDLFSYNDI